MVIRPLVLFDLTRLLSAAGRSAPTGIERVEYAYARWLLGQSGVDVRFVLTAARNVRLVADAAVPGFLDRQAATWQDGAQGFSAHVAIHNVNHFLSGAGGPQAPLLGYLSAEERERRRAMRTPEGRDKKRPLTSWAQRMIANWAGEPIAPLLRLTSRKRPITYLRASLDRMERPGPIERIKAFDAVKMVTFCHDIIPIDFPEYVRPAAVTQCADRVRTMARLADGIIVNSHYSARRLKPYLDPYRPQLKVSYIGSDQAPEQTPTSLPPLAQKPYFLVISTIEARKNHVLLFNIWRRLVEELGDRAPRLVIAGKRGWEAQTPIAILDRVGGLSGHVYEAGAVPDAALDVLRRNALAVLMPSFVEGFGMPVTEALSVATPVIASDIPVFREVVGDAADLIDPLDGPAWQRAIVDYCQPGSRRRADSLARARAYRSPSWDRHFADVRTFLDEVADGPPAVGLVAKARRALNHATLERPFESVVRTRS